VKIKLNAIHFFIGLSILIYLFQIYSYKYPIAGPEGLYPDYLDNLFSVNDLVFIFNNKLVQHIPMALFPLAVLYIFFPQSKIISLLIVFGFFILNQLNQTLAGVDLVLYSIYFLIKKFPTKFLF
jgi:hypothetical protein